MEETNHSLADELRKIIKQQYKDRVIWAYLEKAELIPCQSIDNLEATNIFTPEDVKILRGGDVKDANNRETA